RHPPVAPSDEVVDVNSLVAPTGPVDGVVERGYLPCLNCGRVEAVSAALALGLRQGGRLGVVHDVLLSCCAERASARAERDHGLRRWQCPQNHPVGPTVRALAGVESVPALD